MTSPVASVTNLKLKFTGEDALLFKGVSLSFRQGEKVLLLGPSGCGKSTLLQVLSGLIPSSIEVPMKADDIVIPKHWGFVFQDPDTQFCMPYVDEELAFVLENMQVPREEMPVLIDHYLKKVGLLLADPHTQIHSLSQGMKQRLAIASILAMKPDVLFLDEPTALLDAQGTKQVWDTIRSIAHDKTLIVVEHKIDGILDLFDRIVVFSPNGAVIANGSKDDIFASHKQELKDFGIWYPSVWDDYLSERRERPEQLTGLTITLPSLIKGSVHDALMELEGFRGLRGSTAVIEVEKASIGAREWIGIMGDNGAGKSSLLLAIMRLIKTEGSCTVAGVQLNKVEDLAEHIAFVFQNPEFQFVTHSVKDEIQYSLLLEGMSAGQRQEKADELMDWLQLREVAERHPYQLSMGQKRRLSVASAIIRGQTLLLLDEPTFGLDARNTFSMLEKLEQLRLEGTTIIMVTHDTRITENFCTSSWHIKDGRLTHAIDLSPSGNLAAQR
jgi:energy-coupling factor transporter ATP-binding protein EcfA2